MSLLSNKVPKDLRQRFTELSSVRNDMFGLLFSLGEAKANEERETFRWELFLMLNFEAINLYYEACQPAQGQVLPNYQTLENILLIIFNVSQMIHTV